MGKDSERKRLPAWLRMKMPGGSNYSRVKNLSKRHQLHTICSSGNCPNIGECWSEGTATFMILGDICTRNCKFCNVKTGKPLPVDDGEPMRVAESVKILQLDHCVVTSVDRDDLTDGGAEIWAKTIREIKRLNPRTGIEALIPDFNGNRELLKLVAAENPDVISHNLETVQRLTPQIRSRARYETSLDVIKYLASTGSRTKSGIMLGLGETEDEIYTTMDDLLKAGCKIMTIGQYLAPSKNHIRVVEYIKPELFEKYKPAGLEKGFEFIESSPLVRSSYHAHKHSEKRENKNNIKYAEQSNISGSGIR